MRREAVERNALSVAPAGGYVEVVQSEKNTKESHKQFIPLSALGAPTEGYVAPVYPTGGNQAISGSGVLPEIDLNSVLTTVETTAAGTSILSLGVPGQIKTIKMVADVGDCVITVAGDGISSITLNDVGDAITLMCTGTGWQINDNDGCAVA